MRPRWSVATVALAVLCLSVLHAFVLRAMKDRTVIYGLAPVETVSAEHRAQVDQVRRFLVPALPVIYLDPSDEGWQAGMWERSLYPVNPVLRRKTATQARTLKARIESTHGRPPVVVLTSRFAEDAGFARTIDLKPDDPSGAPLRLGLWSDGPTTR